MKKINVLLSILIIIILILIIVKICRQEVKIEKINNFTESEEQLQYEAQREFSLGEYSEYAEFREDGYRVNISSEMKKEQEVEKDVKVKGFNLEYKDGYTYIYAIVQNDSNEEKGEYPVNLVILTEDGKEVNSLNSYLSKINPGEETLLSTNMPGDLSTCYKIEVRRDGEEK